MPSNALAVHLETLLGDADELVGVARRVRDELGGSFSRLTSANRATVIMCVSAWEACIEELVRESLEALRPPSPPLGLWPALDATIRGQLGRFNNPNVENVRMLLSDALGLPDLHLHWRWQNCTTAQAAQRLATAISERHQIAHGVNPRPVVHYEHAARLPQFFRRLARCADDAVRRHLVAVHGIAHPWPA